MRRWRMMEPAGTTDETGNGADLIACPLIPRPGAGELIEAVGL